MAQVSQEHVVPQATLRARYKSAKAMALKLMLKENLANEEVANQNYCDHVRRLKDALKAE